MISRRSISVALLILSTLIMVTTLSTSEAGAQDRQRPGAGIRLADPATLARKLGIEWKDLDRHIADAVARRAKPLTKADGVAMAVHLRAARELVLAGDLKQAREVLAKAQAIDATFLEVEFLHGVILFHAEDPEAEVFWRDWYKRHPDDFFARNYLAVILRDSNGDWKAKENEAYALAELNAKLHPKSLSAQVTRMYVGLFRGITDVKEREALVPTIFRDAYALSKRLDVPVAPSRQAGAADVDPLDIALTLDEAYFMAKILAAMPSDEAPDGLSIARCLIDRAAETPGPFQNHNVVMQMLSNLPILPEPKDYPKRTK